MDNFASQDREAQRWNSGSVGPENVLEMIVLEISDNSVRARLTGNEIGDLRIEMLDTFFGPLDLGADTI